MDFGEMSKDNESVTRVKFGNFRLSENAITVGDIVVLDDNLDSDWAEMKPDNPRKKDVPAKLMAAFCIICLEGKMSFTINQKDYELVRNCGLICMPGAIVDRKSVV